MLFQGVRENESIPVDPIRVLRVEGHELVEQDVSDWRHTHGRTRVARVGLERGIDLSSPSNQPLLVSHSTSSCAAQRLIWQWRGTSATYGQQSDGVNGELILVGIA